MNQIQPRPSRDFPLQMLGPSTSLEIRKVPCQTRQTLSPLLHPHCYFTLSFAMSIKPDSSFVDVLIIGAGPAGLMCVNALARFGVKVRIVDMRQVLNLLVALNPPF